MKTCKNCNNKIRLTVSCNRDCVLCDQCTRDTPDGLRHVPHDALGVCDKWEE